MSQVEVKRLVERMDADEAFRERLATAETVEQRTRLLAAEGYDLTEEEAAAAALGLGDAGLDDVAGGGGDIYLSGGEYRLDRPDLTLHDNQNLYGRAEMP